MKTKYLFILCVLVLGSFLSQAQIVNIPDANFKNALVNYNVVDFDGDGIVDDDVDTNNDGEIQLSEAEAVLGLELDVFLVDTIQTLEGIESFINLEWIDIFGHELGALDLTQNTNLIKIICNNNELQALQLPSTNSLIEVSCNFNELDSLDVSQVPNLEILKCVYNEILSIDISGNLNLERLNIDSNNLSNLDISNNLNLSRLSFAVNKISAIDVSNNLLLTRLEADSNLLSYLDVTNNTSLEILRFSRNQIYTINISNNPNLTNLVAFSNFLSEIDISINQNLVFFDVYDNQIVDLDISNNTSIMYLSCSNNNLKSLSVKNGNNNKLYQMYAMNNPELLCIEVDDEDAIHYDCDPIFGTGWCKDETATYSEFCELGIEDFAANEIVLYPNPADKILTIQSKVEIEKVTIYTLQGVMVREYYDTNGLDVSNLSQGVYFVEITSEGKKAIQKFIKL